LCAWVECGMRMAVQHCAHGCGAAFAWRTLCAWVLYGMRMTVRMGAVRHSHGAAVRKVRHGGA